MRDEPDQPGPRPLLPAVDRASLVATLADRLRGAGVPIAMSALAAFSDAMATIPPVRRTQLYWQARITLVRRERDLPVFDRIFEAVFGDAQLAVDPHARRAGAGPGADVPPERPGTLRAVPGDQPPKSGETSLPWHTLPRTRPDDDAAEESRALPELLPSAVARIADLPLDELDEGELRILGRWLEQTAYRWPTRRSRRQQLTPHGGRIAMRATIAASRRTGWEPMTLQRLRPARRPLTVTLLCDVSQSMQGYATAYLHLMRVFARTGRAEAFAFSTTLTRLTPAMSHRSPEAAIALANDHLADRYGGTRLASCLRELLASRHGHAIRGGVLVIASDGWDADDPEELRVVMARARRRARRVVWLNPRAAAAGFEPRVGSVVAALPYCDAFLAADTLRALPEVFDAIADPAWGQARVSSRA